MRDYDAVRAEMDDVHIETENLRQLLEHPGWKSLDDRLGAQMRSMRQEIFNNGIRSLDEAFQRSHDMASVGVLQYCHGLPRMLLEECEQRQLALQDELHQLRNDPNDDE